MAVSAPFPPTAGTPRRGRPRKDATAFAPPAPAGNASVPPPPPPPSGPAGTGTVQAAPVTSQLVPAPAASQPAPAPVAQPAPAVQTAEVAVVKVRHGLPVYIASQSKLLLPNHTYPVIVDRWVRHQLSLRNGVVVKV